MRRYSKTDGGFVQVPVVLLEDITLVPIEKLLYVLLLRYDYGGRHGEVWPSQGQLAFTLGISSRQVQRILQRLQQNGLLFIEQRPGRASVYHLRLRVTEDGVVDERRQLLRGQELVSA